MRSVVAVVVAFLAISFGASGLHAQPAAAPAPTAPPVPAPGVAPPAPAAAQATLFPESRKCGLLSAEELLRRSYSFKRSGAAIDAPVDVGGALIRGDGITTIASASDDKLRKDARKAAAGGQLLLIVRRPGDDISADDWESAYVYGAAQTELKKKVPANPGEADEAPVGMVPIGVSIRDRSKDQALLDITLPKARDGQTSENWTLVPVFCGRKDAKLLGFGSAKVVVVSKPFAAWLTIGFVVLFWVSVSFATMQFYKEKFKTIWEKEKTLSFKKYYSRWRSSYKVWSAFQSANPLFISQDSLGYASLSRFQILIFSTVVGGMILYVFIHSGVLSDLSDTVLLTLGITIAGSTFGRAIGDWTGIKPENRQWLIGNKVLEPQSDKPRWSDLFSSQGEIDVAKVQAFLFTGLIAVAIIVNGSDGLSTFTVPTQIMYLSGISQLAYVAGRLVPSETRTKIDEDLDSLTAIASAVAKDPNDAALKDKYAWAKESARRTLRDTYGEKFDNNAFNVATR